jgi:hypothetical protein
MTFERACDMVSKGQIPILERLQKQLSDRAVIPETTRE